MKAPECLSARHKKRFFDSFIFCSDSDSDIDGLHSQRTPSIALNLYVGNEFRRAL
ncbi:hypothetical protein NDA03_19505 [Trichocoleus sp. Lan]|uniref:hypothetical protein n=1 Tax=Trichocoleus sp. Lan TaxID=2933927 RepID=UPI0032977D7F